MKTTQMNTRIDGQLKTAGDAALAKAGYSPSQAVRHIWEWAAAHSYEPDVIDDFLSSAVPSIAEEMARKRERKTALVEEGLVYAEEMLADLGLTQHSDLASARLANNELRDLMYEEMLEKHTGVKR